MSAERDSRAKLGQAQRVVVKIGTRVLAQANGRPHLARMRALVGQIARARREGREVVVVSSGAVAAGMEALGLRRRPRTLPDLQMCAAVGQSRLMARYDRLFGARRCAVGQVLLTHDGLKMRERHLNARNTLLKLLRNGIIPIVNENDAVSVEEIRFGDNDVLAALVGLLIDADALILLTTVDGLRAPAGPRTRRVPWLGAVTPSELALVFGASNELSTGGMASKLEAAEMLAGVGGRVVIANGRSEGIVTRILAGEDTGTLIGGAGRRGPRGRRRWIAFFHRVNGTLIVDDGAAEALERRGRSLLPIGLRGVEGAFPAGAVVNVKTARGRLVGRGLSSYSAADIRRIMGRRTSELPAILGERRFDEVIHRDNLTVFHAVEGVQP